MAGLFQISDFRGLRFLVLGLRLLAFGFDPRPKTQDPRPKPELQSKICNLKSEIVQGAFDSDPLGGVR